ncbi:MAG: protein kinase [Planctomycetaceae bacterium]|nr:protein kinase [Planctomycetaceae bacterium]
MSTGVQHPSESSGTAFAFVRPLPGSGRVSDSSFSQPKLAGEIDVNTLGAVLFPPRHADTDLMPPVTGIQLGHFIIEERIGRGGMGAVFRAIDKRLDRVVALKVLTPHQSLDRQAIQRFQNEARAAAQLDHDHIARVHFVGEEHGLHFIAFEFVSGTNIRDFILQKSRIDAADAVSYTLQIAEALRHTAAKNVVHRDIKPSNIIVSSTGCVKLVDLGLARQLRPEESGTEDLTVAGTALGTFDYISPEQARDARNVDVRSDIYSLGCTLYHMLTGEPPYPRGSMIEKVVSHHGTPPDPSLKNPQVTPQLARVVQKMMASNPDERYASPDLLIQDLIQIADDLGLAQLPAEGYIWSKPLFSRRRFSWDGTKTWMTFLVALVVMAVLADRMPWFAGESRNTPFPADQQPTPPAAPAPVIAPPAPAMIIDQPAAADQGPVVATPSDPNESGVAAALSAWERLMASSGATTNSVIKTGEGLPLEATPSVSPKPAATIGPEPLGPAMVPLATLDPRSTLPNETPASPTPRTPDIKSPGPGQLFQLVTDSGMQTYGSLYAAVTDAPDNSVIELAYDGREAGPQDPIRVSGKRVRIRSAEGYRPLLEFRLKSSGTTGSLNNSVRMISIVNGGIEFYDLDLEMQTAAQVVVDQWSLISLTGRSELLLKGCSCTVMNSQNSPAAVFELPLRQSADLTQMMKDQMQMPGTTLRLEECVIRGQADMVQQRHAYPTTAVLKNVAVAVSGHLLRLDGRDVVSMPSSDSAPDMIELALDHVTAVLGGGLIDADSGNYGRFPLIQVDSRDSLYSLLNPERPFVEFSGHEELDVLAERLVWIGRREPNFFELLGPMWVIDAPQSLGLEPRRTFSFDAWTEYWGEAGDAIVRSGLFRNPKLGPVEALSRMESADFVLRSGDVVPNPALSATADRRDCGVDWSLPRVPRKLPVP